MSGIFIVLEGIEGSGKSTQAGLLMSALAQRVRGREIWLTCEPSKGMVGRFIRNRVLSGGHTLDERTIGHLFIADRYDHVRTEIEPELNRGNIVVCDRYALTTVAHQSTGVSLRFSADEVLRMHRKLPRPDLTIYLRVPLGVSLERIKARGGKEMYDHVKRITQISDVYEELQREHCALQLSEEAVQILKEHHLVSVDGWGTVNEVADRVLQAVIDGGLLDPHPSEGGDT